MSSYVAGSVAHRCKRSPICGSGHDDLRSYRAKQVSMPQLGRCQGFGGAITQIVVFRAIELKPLSPIQLACNCKAFSISI